MKRLESIVLTLFAALMLAGCAYLIADQLDFTKRSERCNDLAVGTHVPSWCS